MIDLAHIERQPILIDRLERYRRAHKIGSLGEAIEHLIRIGLFTDAAPDGATLMRRGNQVEWSAPPKSDAALAPWDPAPPPSDDGYRA